MFSFHYDKIMIYKMAVVAIAAAILNSIYSNIVRGWWFVVMVLVFCLLLILYSTVYVVHYYFIGSSYSYFISYFISYYYFLRRFWDSNKKLLQKVCKVPNWKLATRIRRNDKHHSLRIVIVFIIIIFLSLRLK